MSNNLRLEISNHQMLMTNNLIINFLRLGKVENKFLIKKIILNGFIIKKIQLAIIFLKNFLMLLEIIIYLK